MITIIHTNKVNNNQCYLLGVSAEKLFKFNEYLVDEIFKREMAHHNELGKIGEQLATEFLQKKGYNILARNFFYNKAEIDIIAQKEDDTIVMIEVKTRNSSFFGDPQSFVTAKKIKLLVKAANEYMIVNNLDKEVRFDIIAVLKNKTTQEIEHFENAFYHF